MEDIEHVQQALDYTMLQIFTLILKQTNKKQQW